MIAEVIKEFRDLKANVLRSPGERFEVTDERFAEINGTKYGIFAKAVEMPEEIADDTEDVAEYVRPRRSRKQD